MGFEIWGAGYEGKEGKKIEKELADWGCESFVIVLRKRI